MSPSWKVLTWCARPYVQSQVPYISKKNGWERSRKAGCCDFKGDLGNIEIVAVGTKSYINIAHVSSHLKKEGHTHENCHLCYDRDSGVL